MQPVSQMSPSCVSADRHRGIVAWVEDEAYMDAHTDGSEHGTTGSDTHVRTMVRWCTTLCVFLRAHLCMTSCCVLDSEIIPQCATHIGTRRNIRIVQKGHLD